MRGALNPRTMTAKIRTGLLAMVMVMSSSTARAGSEDAVKMESAYSFGETLSRLRSALESKGFEIFAAIDHRAAAQSVGLDMPPTMVLIYGNPRGGTPLMLAAPDFALELPLRVLVREGKRGEVYVTYNPAVTLEGKHGLPAGMAEKLAPAEKIISSAVATPSDGK